jgi:preprotein translocase SecF subunit
MRLRLVRDVTTFDFMRWARWAVIGSIALFLVALASIPVHGLNLGIDFRGGTMIMAQTDGPPDLAAMRTALAAAPLGEVSITEISDPAAELTGGAERNGVMIRVGALEGQDTAQADIVATTLEALQPVDDTVRVLGVETVGARVSGELLRAGVLALALSVGAMLIYIWLRFEWQFAVGAVVALVHDVTLTIGFFILLQLEFNLTIVAALLTLIGYGINDTVVVFDRVRENLRRYKTMPLKDLINLSVNQTLARTVMTTVTTFLAVFAMFVLGGEVLRGFTVAILWGVLVGAYSTVFIAAVVVLWLGVEREAKDPGPAAGVRFGSPEAP